VRKLNAAGAGAIGLLYYSGHGAAERDTNINYLIPVDAREPETSSFWDESVKLDNILKLLDGALGQVRHIRCLSQRAATADQRHERRPGADFRATGHVYRLCQRPGAASESR